MPVRFHKEIIVHRSITAAAAVGALVAGLALTAPVASAAPTSGAGPTPNGVAAGKSRDDLPSALKTKQRALRSEALQNVLQGDATVQNRYGSKVVKVGKDRRGRAQYAELAREKTDKVFVVLAEFGNQRSPDYPDLNPDTRPNPASTFDGPAHNQIAKPDRVKDNTTLWQPNYSADYYRNLLFGTKAGANTVSNYFSAQSSGRYGVEGSVTDWVKLPYNEARYGRNTCGDVVCTNVWAMIQDAVNQWVKDQQAKGVSDADIKASLAQYDTRDRYDYDSDGNFNEPDGYLDRFVIIHAGADEAAGGGAQGEDAIWSHSWYANASDQGKTGPAYNRAGGAQIGDTGYWVGDYTTDPENGGVGVFAHEFSHDLGLPDEYDQTYTGEAPSGFWSLMSSGSYLGDNKVEGLGDRPGDLSGFAKLQMGWLNYKLVEPRSRERITLGPSEMNTQYSQAAVVRLPLKKKVVTLAKPPQGSNAWWSGSGDDLNTTMTRDLTLPAGQPAALALTTWYDIEQGYDYAYVEVNDGSGWTALRSALTDANGGITGTSGGKWVPTSFDLSAYAGKTVQLRFRYTTDGGLSRPGFLVDAISVTSGTTTVFSDGAENGANGWTLSGFTTTTGEKVTYEPAYYIAENRTYTGYDQTLRTGPYNFGFLPSQPDVVQFFPYQKGLLVSQWDTRFTDNQTGVHPGEGLILPIDARPVPFKAPNGQYWRTRVQVYDATFGLKRTDAFTLYQNSVPQDIPSKAPVSTFDDSKKYWYAQKPDAGVKVDDTGTEISVLRQSGNTMSVLVDTRP